jgi:hypothetical protein
MVFTVHGHKSNDYYVRTVESLRQTNFPFFRIPFPKLLTKQLTWLYYSPVSMMLNRIETLLVLNGSCLFLMLKYCLSLKPMSLVTTMYKLRGKL